VRTGNQRIHRRSVERKSINMQLLED